ncbi:hypothetical protein BDN70DRAFT_902002 [Pholiota conissans]|uniref:Uncharacterized protein n=1 Tax=Pholiota conissans TaxID=109636 RepID=A0A9P5YN03_9AGAR|nr:hypothetical protein BDN70DRAFT_902002 [Pholiota conissans]
MDEFYPFEKARKELETLNRGAQDSKEMYLNTIELIKAMKRDALQIVQRDEPISWRLSMFNSAEGLMDDAYIRIQGIVCSKILPPVGKLNNPGAVSRIRPHLRQAITITGLGSDLFDNYVQNMEHIYLTFSNHFPDGKLDKWEPAMYQGVMAFDAHARYFTQKHFVPSSESIPFHSTVDPDGNLESMRGEDMVHAADNEVDYFVQMHNTDNKTIYKRTSPGNFRIGDIVEVTIVILAYPTKDKRYKLIPLLRGILLLNQSYRDEAAILRMRSKYTPAVLQINKLSSKRKSAYLETDEVEDTEKKMSRMSL